MTGVIHKSVDAVMKSCSTNALDGTHVSGAAMNGCLGLNFAKLAEMVLSLGRTVLQFATVSSIILSCIIFHNLMILAYQ